MARVYVYFSRLFSAIFHPLAVDYYQIKWVVMGKDKELIPLPEHHSEDLAWWSEVKLAAWPWGSGEPLEDDEDEDRPPYIPFKEKLKIIFTHCMDRAAARILEDWGIELPDHGQIEEATPEPEPEPVPEKRITQAEMRRNICNHGTVNPGRHEALRCHTENIGIGPGMPPPAYSEEHIKMAVDAGKAEIAFLKVVDIVKEKAIAIKTEEDFQEKSYPNKSIWISDGNKKYRIPAPIYENGAKFKGTCCKSFRRAVDSSTYVSFTKCKSNEKVFSAVKGIHKHFYDKNPNEITLIVSCSPFDLERASREIRGHMAINDYCTMHPGFMPFLEDCNKSEGTVHLAQVFNLDIAKMSKRMHTMKQRLNIKRIFLINADLYMNAANIKEFERHPNGPSMMGIINITGKSH